ncbi:MAG: hypothetical protein QOF78_104 [Phycisphaerales bacterium]|jgi:hypothetical protein|nr:hypothetical protein [Phycisphaerales bacterium]
MRKIRTSAALAAAALAVGLSPSMASAAITVQTTTNATTMVNNLVGGGTGITIVAGSATYTGANMASGTFTGGNFLGSQFTSGVVLTSGDATKLDGPNGGTSDYSTNNGFAGGNTRLDAIVTPQATHNASTLTFKFIPTSDVISFQFVFGSDEYSEFVGSSFNDVFGFFLNGQNIALIPGTTTPVAINNVNNGNTSNNTPAKNSQYFTDNINGGLDTKLDGLVGQKIALFATASVTPGQESTIEIAIADTTDSSYDSAVFLRSGSFIDEPPPPPPTGIPLPAGVWGGMSLLSGLGLFSKIKRRRKS